MPSYCISLEAKEGQHWNTSVYESYLGMGQNWPPPIIGWLIMLIHVNTKNRLNHLWYPRPQDLHCVFSRHELLATSPWSPWVRSGHFAPRWLNVLWWALIIPHSDKIRPTGLDQLQFWDPLLEMFHDRLWKVSVFLEPPGLLLPWLAATSLPSHGLEGCRGDSISHGRCSLRQLWLTPGVADCITQSMPKKWKQWKTWEDIYNAWGLKNHIEQYEFVNGKDDIPYMKWKIKHVWNHQPYIYIYTYVIWEI